MPLREGEVYRVLHVLQVPYGYLYSLSEVPGHWFSSRFERISEEKE